jgi:N-acetylglutamate synthase-like GNAT family acetyltransferase
MKLSDVHRKTNRVDCTFDGSWTAPSTIVVKAVLKQEHKDWTNEWEKEVVRGEALLNVSSHTLYISRIDAKPSGQGFGSEMLKCIIKQAHAHNIPRIETYVENNNADSRSLFRKAGFEEMPGADGGRWRLDLTQVNEAKNYVRTNVAYHDELNPVAWDNNQLNEEVKDRLLEIAERFVNYLELPDFEVLDIVLTGSMANYNWTKFSDFDIHVVTNYSDLQCDDLAEAFYRAKKKIWNDEHDITIYGYDTELYVEDSKQPPVSEGVYSILNNKWLSTPGYNPPTIDSPAVNAKVTDLKKQIDVAISSANDPMDLKRLSEKIRKMRQSGLAEGGEFSVENLAFKVLRNMKYLDKISRAFYQQQDDQLSLK